MRKFMFWLGLAIFILAALCIFLSGSTSGPNLEPTVPFLYNTNQYQPFYLIAGVIGLVILVLGLVMKRKV